MRIRKWQFKLIYAVAAFVILRAIVYILQTLQTPAPLVGIIQALGVFVLFYLGTRWFRGRNESFGPRAWWRMSAYPKASRRLGYLFIVLTVFAVLSAIGSLVPAMSVPGDQLVGGIATAVISIVLAYLYLTSNARLSSAAATATNDAMTGTSSGAQ